MNTPKTLGNLQLRILRSLWANPGATVAEVHAELLPERRLAYTTIATMLRKMELRGLVTHREEGRAYRYSASVHEAEVHRNASRHLIENLFEGSLSDAVSHLLTTREVSSEELDRLEQLIQEARRRTQ